MGSTQASSVKEIFEKVMIHELIHKEEQELAECKDECVWEGAWGQRDREAQEWDS